MIRESLDDILASYAEIQCQDEKLNHEITDLNLRVDKYVNVCENTKQILDDATTEFNGLTSILNPKDIPFFIFSILLQCGVKYYIKVLRELSDKELAQKTPFHHDE